MKSKKYPRVKEGNQVAYMVMHVMVPADIMPAPSVRYLDGLKAAQRVGRVLGIKIWPIRLTLRGSRQGNFRYFLRFPRYRRDDQRARYIAECFLHALALACGPFMELGELASVVRVPAALVRKARSVHVEQLDELEEARAHDGAGRESSLSSLGYAFSTSGIYFDAAWKMTPILVANEQLYRAVGFLKASQDEFFVWPGEIGEVSREPDITAPNRFGQTTLENALQNAFKSVEAVLGDPPKNDAKFFAKLNAIGLDPNEEVGYSFKLPIHTVIRNMNEARDKKAAHGSTIHRGITYGELMEFQACARYVVSTAIESKLGGRIYG